MSHLAQLIFIYPDGISLSYAPNRRSSLGGKAEPILIIDMSGPRPSAPAASVATSSPLKQAFTSLGNGGATPSKDKCSLHAAGQIPSQPSQPTLHAKTPIHSAAPTRMPHRTPIASPANPSPGRAHRQEFSNRMRAWLAQSATISGAALAAQVQAAPTAEAIASAATKAQSPREASIITSSSSGRPAGCSSSAAHGGGQEVVVTKDGLDGHSLPDVPEAEMPPVPTPRTMPLQTPFAMTPLSGGPGGLGSPAALSDARASASLANARRLSFGGGELLSSSSVNTEPTCNRILSCLTSACIREYEASCDI